MTTSAAASEGEDPIGAGYRPFLDGLRAVAVYLVVVFHSGVARLAGGFVGVDVFFVLSGYLVTRLLLRDLTATGRVGYSRFYARRFRRLLPAAFVTLIVTAVVFTAIASPVEVTEAVDGFKAAFLYATNWYFIHQATDYFGADLNTNPVLHFWSLAVEEQFYLLWPLLLGGLWAFTRRFGDRQRHVLRLMVAAGAVLSLGLAWSLRHTNPTHAYYGTDTRAYQLLAGALLALAPGIIRRVRPHDRTLRWTGPVAVAALLAVATSWLHLDAVERGALVTLLTLTVLVSLEAAQGGTLRTVLSWNPITYLGRISYGTYLWHWPVIIVLARTWTLAPITVAAYTTLIATALASLSHELLEHPIRLSPRLNRHPHPVIAAGLATSLVAALVLIPAVTDSRPTSTSSQPIGTPSDTDVNPIPNLDYAAIKKDYTPVSGCFGESASACTLVTGTGPHLLVIGDSFASMLVPAWRQIAHDRNLTLSVADGCPWQRDLRSALSFSVQATCTRQKDDIYDRIVPALDPDIVIAMNAPYERAVRSQVGYVDDAGKVIPSKPGVLDDWVEQTTRRSIQDLEADGRKLVILEPTPVPEDQLDPLLCLSEASATQDCRYVAPASPSGLELLYRQIAERRDDVWSVDLDRLVCPFLPICDPIVNGQVVKLDEGHLTASFAKTLTPALEQYLVSNGVLPR